MNSQINLNIAEITTTVDKEPFVLCNQRVMFWESRKTLILSDIHIGKTAHFRKHGIAIPDEVMHNDLNRLNQVINYYQPKSIIIVGDLFHSKPNTNFNVFKKWLKNHVSIDWILIKGNHDKHSFDYYESFGLRVYKELIIDNFRFIHEPIHHEKNLINISGHLHPGVNLKLRSRQHIKLPCFQIWKNQIILPAFSLFTGLYIDQDAHDKTYFHFSENDIWMMPS